MNETARRSALGGPPPERTDGVDGGLELSASNAFDWVWRTFTSMRTGLFLILILGALAFVGTAIPQVWPGLTSDPQSYAAWLASAKLFNAFPLGGWARILDGLQLFNVFNSIWFRGIMVLLTTSILACSVNRLKGLMKTAVHPRTKMTPTFYTRAPHRAELATEVAATDALAAVRQAFGARHFRTITEDDGETIHVYADRFRWAPFGTLMAHISLVLILVGAFVGGMWGFHDNSVPVPVGSSVEVGHGTGLSVTATRYSEIWDTVSGSVSDYASDLIVYRGGVQVAAQTIRVNDPLHINGVTFYQSGFGPAAVMKVTDASGTVLFDKGIPMYDQGDGYVYGEIPLQNSGSLLQVVEPSSGRVDSQIAAGQVRLDVFQAGSTQAGSNSTVLTQGSPANVAGLTVTFMRDTNYTGLSVASDPGAIFVWLGAILLVTGVCLVFFFQNRRIWAAVRRMPTGSEVVIGATTRHDATFGSDFKRLVDDLTTAMSRPSAA